MPARSFAATFAIININNTNTTLALANRTRLKIVEKRLTAKVDLTWLHSLRQTHPELPVVLSSVVPKKLAVVREAFEAEAARPIFEVKGTEDLGFSSALAKPDRDATGADRLANAAAAAERAKSKGRPVVVIDSGTATTLDVVDATGRFLGGPIFPGAGMLANALHEHTAQLPVVELKPPRRAIGRTTETALQSGVVFGYYGMLRELLQRVASELDQAPLVIATGGLGRFVARGLPEVHELKPLLTLHGLRIIGAYRLVHAAHFSNRND